MGDIRVMFLNVKQSAMLVQEEQLYIVNVALAEMQSCGTWSIAEGLSTRKNHRT